MFVARRGDNSIYGCWTVRQSEGQEELADNDPEIIAFRTAGDAGRASLAADENAAKNYTKLSALKNMNPGQVDSWVQTNVNTLADAKDTIKTLAIAVSILARRL